MRFGHVALTICVGALSLAAVGCGPGPGAGHPKRGMKPPSTSSSKPARTGKMKSGHTGKPKATRKMNRTGHGSAASSQWMPQQNPMAKTVTFKVVAAYNNAANGYNFDGGAHGNLTFTVPVDWKVTMRFTNRAAVPHSAVVAASRTASTPAFAGAATPSPTSGLPKGQAASFTFTANRAGNYYLVCAVPGHEVLGMWDKVVISSSAHRPSVKGP